MTIQFTVYGTAVPQRERSFVVDGRMGRYVTKETKDWRAVIQAQAVEHKPETLPLGAIHLAVEFVLPRPGYLMAAKYYWRCKWKKCGWKGTEGQQVDCLCPECGCLTSRPTGTTPPHTVKPDCQDNLMKPLSDSLTGLFWKDDAQIVDSHATKRWAEMGEQPHVSISIQTEG